MDTLRSRWHADVLALVPAAEPECVTAEGQRLLERWTQPHRSYHDVVHLAEVLAALDELSEGGELPPRERHLAALVGWYHDAVYDPAMPAGTSEEASAVLAEEGLSMIGLASDLVARVARLVLESAVHEMTSTDAVSSCFHDADLWILSAPTERFDTYCRQVRLEYGMVADDIYARGRAAVLTPFVERERLYLSDHAHRRWTRRARLNLRRELDRLAPPA